MVTSQEHLGFKPNIYFFGLKLKQSSSCWDSVLDQHLKKLAFILLVSDPCIFKASVGKMFMRLAYCTVSCRSNAKAYFMHALTSVVNFHSTVSNAFLF